MRTRPVPGSHRNPWMLKGRIDPRKPHPDQRQLVGINEIQPVSTLPPQTPISSEVAENSRRFSRVEGSLRRSRRDSMAEECMFRLQCRGSIAGAAVMVALLCARPANAQVGVDPGPPREPGGLCRALITGAEYDIVNLALAEHRLQYLQAKLTLDAERGDKAAVDRDVHLIDKVKYRMAIHEWLVRWNSREYARFYPIRTDAVSAAAIAQAAHPTPSPYPRQIVQTAGLMAAAPTIPITIVNTEPAGAGLTFDIDGVTHQAAAGSRRTWTYPRARASPTTLADRSASAGI